MPAPSGSYKIAAVQVPPVYLDRDATVEKACELIVEAGRNGASVIAFPEAFIPTYPDWVWAVPPGDSQTLYALYGELLANSVTIPSTATEKLCRAARTAKACVVIGVNERNAEASGGSLYNTLLYIGHDGHILGKHRKLVPTGAERLVWAQGDGSTLEAYDTPFGKLGGLICWENYMPLARYTMYAWGTQIYVAATWDSGEPWLSTLRHIAKEGRMYVIGVCMPMRTGDIPDQYEFKRKFYGDRDWINVGDSAIAGPDGNFIAGPVREREDILYADIDLHRLSSSKWMLDVAGHYARPDVFQLVVNREQQPMITSRDGASASSEEAPRKTSRRKQANR
ncbi:MAG: nitrilase [Chloroflexi bacterium RBG_16_64_32]|nr:MAG: nitrilase [Chloroflexi bacterium RBG_16_64_32]